MSDPFSARQRELEALKADLRPSERSSRPIRRTAGGRR